MISLSPIKIVEEKIRSLSDGISLAQGIPTYCSTSKFLELLISDSANSAIHAYSSPKGSSSLRQLLCKNTSIDPDKEILISNGATCGLLAALIALRCKEGGEVIVFTPYYSSYVGVVKAAGMKCVPCPTIQLGSEVDWESLSRAITPRTEAVLFSSPNNPSGELLSKESCEKLVAAAHFYGFTILSDETYRELVWQPNHMISPFDLPGGKDVVVRIRSFSKTYGITGWRIGAVEARSDFIESVTAVHDLCVVCAPSPAQALLIRILSCPDDIVGENRLDLKRRVEYVWSQLKCLGMFVDVRMPSAGYFLFPEVVSQCGDMVSKALREVCRVGVVPGRSFGDDYFAHVRISAAAPMQTLESALGRLHRFDSATVSGSVRRRPKVAS